MEQFFKDLQALPHIERVRMLDACADDVKRGQYYRNFSKEEIADLKELNTTNDLEIQALEEEKKAVVEPINERLKELKNTKKHTLTNIKEGRESISGEYYIFHDEEERKTYHVSPKGDVIFEGPYTGYQKTIASEIRKTANG